MRAAPRGRDARVIMLFPPAPDVEGGSRASVKQQVQDRHRMPEGRMKLRVLGIARVVLPDHLDALVPEALRVDIGFRSRAGYVDVSPSSLQQAQHPVLAPSRFG